MSQYFALDFFYPHAQDYLPKNRVGDAFRYWYMTHCRASLEKLCLLH
jgi:hypothetical protein